LILKFQSFASISEVGTRKDWAVQWLSASGDWVKTQIRNGSFTNESKYIRNLIRRDQNQNAEFLATKEAIVYNIKSSISEIIQHLL